MKPERYRQVKEIFAAAVQCEARERADFLARACASDEELRMEVESLLAHDQSAEDFIEESAFEVAARLLADDEAQPLKERRIGPYRVVREIGRGGMGVVYLAVRDDDHFHKEVAIKLIKRGMDTDAVVRRFRNERQILAGFEHPFIARLLDGGATADGLPFLVMEYVAGTPLTDYCDRHGLTTSESLQLFRSVCAAVEHAHQNLIVHRDLKPTNILITEDGTPKLLDFGIAKVLNPVQPDLTVEQTRPALRALTPDYASPEQLRGQKITTASDIYSLGVILYELLTGTRPYNLKDSSPEEMLHVICDTEPTRPSEAGSSQLSSERLTTDRQRSTNTRAQTRSLKSLKGDLDNIVMTALRKEPARRYKTVEQFSEDIRRHLAGLPVIARKDTFSYRASKFVGRNRVAVLAASLIVLAILSGLIVALWQAEAARRQRDLAQRERVKAERINQFLHRMLSFSNQSITSVSPVAARRDVTVNEMLDQITPQVEAELADQPDVRAQVLRTIGSAYASQGQYEAAERNLRAALDAQTRLYGEESVEAAATMTELGVLSYRQVKLDEASRLLEKAVAFYRKQREAKSPEYSAAHIAQALDYFGVVKFWSGDAKASLSLLNEALQIASGANLQGNERGILASIKTNLGSALVSSGDLEKGETLLRESLAEFRQISSQPRWELGVTLMMMGAAALNRNQPNEAEKYLLESEQILRETLGESNIYRASTLDRQAAALFLKNDLKAAEEKARESLLVFQKSSPGNKLGWATPMWTLGDILTKAGRAREGEDYYRQALVIYEQQSPKNYNFIATLKIRLSQSLLVQNRLAEAEPVALEARAEANQHLGEQSPLTKAATDNLIKIYEKQGKHDLAQRLK